MLNPDGISVKGCKIIYAPAGQAGEYSPLAANPYRGCGHGCKYCYVPQVIHMPRPEFDKGAVPRENFLERLTADAIKYREHGITEQVMLSFTTDPYHLGDTTLTTQTLTALRDHGLGFCTLTKGGVRALQDIDLFRPDRDAFACTLTAIDVEFSRLWEPNAATPGDRMHALYKFHQAGIFTWVSLEPTLDVNASLDIIRQTHDDVDLYKIGRANYVPSITKTTDWQDYTLRIIELCHKLGVKHYIKKDLQPFLPEGYTNRMRVEQFHAS
jgi:DNA repair photolyase